MNRLSDDTIGKKEDDFLKDRGIKRVLITMIFTIRVLQWEYFILLSSSNAFHD